MGIYQYRVLPICSTTRYLIKLVICLLCVMNLESCMGYRILGIFPVDIKSHMIMFEQLMKGLAERGHQVDVVSTFHQKTPIPNYSNIIIPSALPTIINNKSYADVRQSDGNNMVYRVSTRFGNFNCEKGLHNSQLQDIIHNPPNDPPYDLVIVEIFAAHCFIAFGHHLNVPVIGISSSALYPWSNDMIGNPENLAFTANNLLGYAEKMNFHQRFYNVIHTFFYKKFFNYLTSSQTDIIRKHFGLDTPDIRELEKSLALVLTNSHSTFQGMVPKVPALIEVGGLHVQDDGAELSSEDQKWLDASTDGFVYFTFGSMVTIESFPDPVLQILFKSLAKISPVRVLMKVPRPEMLSYKVPENIRTFSWIPQLKVLKHKNIRAFITHGGLMGIQEALTYAVPMIGIPLFSDQFINIDLCVKKHIAVKIDHNTITEEILDNALHEVLHNPVYKKSAKEASNKFLDRPMSAMETACFWTEYVIRHGSDALRSPSVDLPWWQIALLDVYAVILALVSLFAIISVFILRISINALFARQKYKKKIN